VRTAHYLLVVLVAAFGCSDGKPYKTAAVSGRVTLDGKPLPGAMVSFTPVNPPGAALTGPGARGETDADGKYTLKTAFAERGGTIGRNRVFISTRKFDRPADQPEATAREVAPEKVPAKYFTDRAAIYFEVPAGGTSEANFDLTK
jgi:hypothetical protein